MVSRVIRLPCVALPLHSRNKREGAYELLKCFSSLTIESSFTLLSIITIIGPRNVLSGSEFTEGDAINWVANN
jgi:hypothetical protein